MSFEGTSKEGEPKLAEKHSVRVPIPCGNCGDVHEKMFVYRDKHLCVECLVLYHFVIMEGVDTVHLYRRESCPDCAGNLGDVFLRMVKGPQMDCKCKGTGFFDKEIPLPSFCEEKT